MKRIILYISIILCFTIAKTQEVNMDYYIHLKITPGTTLYVEMLGPKTNTPVMVVNGDKDTIAYIPAMYGNNKSLKNYFISGTGDTDYKFNITNLKEENTDFYIYGDVIYFRCHIQKNVKEIVVEHNPILEWLIVDGTSITSLDISKNQNLWMLQCYNNELTSLDISNNPNLRALFAHGNKFTSDIMDQIICDLADRTGKGDSTYLYDSKDIGHGIIEFIYGTNDPNYNVFLKTNVQNALNKNWVVVDSKNIEWNIKTTGSYDCSSSVESVAQAIELNVFPNPASDILNISCNEIIKSVSLINILGQEVYFQKSNLPNAKINTSKLTSGNYILKIETLENIITKSIVIN